MTNWLVDPNSCVRRIKNEEGSCGILAAQNEVMSRSTMVKIDREPAKGRKPETTTWYADNVEVYREGEDSRRTNGAPNLNLVRYNKTTNHGFELNGLSPAECVTMSDVLRAAAVNSGGSACGGKTILECLWDEMDSIMDRLMTGQEAADGRDAGRAEGLAYAIAVMNNPYLPSIDQVRTQAVERWEQENPDDDA